MFLIKCWHLEEQDKYIKKKNNFIARERRKKMMSLSAKDKEKMRIFAGSSSKKLAEKIANYLDMKLS